MVCLDTSFLIDVIKGKEEVNTLEEELVNRGTVLTIASPSIVEIFKGLYLKYKLKHVSGDEISRIGEILSTFVILSLDKDSAEFTGRIEAEQINTGKIIDIEDIMIGAICVTNHEKLLTRNVKHFEKIHGLEIEAY